MSELKSYKDLLVWQKAMSLVTDIYRISRDLPEQGKYGLISQAKRCAVSVPSNIAEGWGRFSSKNYLRFFRNSKGSLFEPETQLILIQDLEFGINCETKLLEIKEISKKLISLIKSISKKHELEYGRSN